MPTLKPLLLSMFALLLDLNFGALEGHLLLIHKALYGLRSSRARWHGKLSDVLRKEGFVPCKAEPDIWMHQDGDQYKYDAIYVNDLAFSVKKFVFLYPNTQRKLPVQD